MASLVKVFKSAFLIDRSKLTRLVTIAHEQIAVHPDRQKDLLRFSYPASSTQTSMR